MIIRKIFYIFTLFILLVNVVVAQSEKHEESSFMTDEIVVEGIKIFKNIYYSPTKIKLIDCNEIKSKNGQRLSDILELSGSVYLKSYGSNSSLNTISLNGSGAEHTLFLIDGNRIGTFQNSQIDISQISKDNIEKIEIINNGYSSIFGSDAVSGVVNIITKTPGLSIKPKFNISTQFGSFGFNKYYINISKSFSKFSFSGSANLESSRNNFNYFYLDGVDQVLRERQNSSYRYKDFSFSTIYYPDRKTTIRLNTNYTSNFRNLPGIETGTPSVASTQIDNIFYSFVNLETAFSKHSSFKSALSFQNNQMNYENKPYINSYYKNIIISNNSQVEFRTFVDIILGYELNYGKLYSNELENNPERLQASLIIVSNLKLLANDKLNIFPSVRYDYFSDTKLNNVSMKIGLNYKILNNKEIYLKSSLGNNFRIPTFNELFWKQGGNKNLSQEKSFNFDIGLIYGFKLFADNLFEVTYSNNVLSDKIIWIPNANGLWSPVNIGQANINSFIAEFKSKKNVSGDISMLINLSFNYNRSLNNVFVDNNIMEKQQIYVPKYVFKLNTGIEYKKISMNFFYQYISKRFTDIENIYYLPEIDLLDGNISYGFNIDKLNFVLRVETNNIFNKNYQFISGYPMPLRNYKLGLQIIY
jgi:iron complex outermembrane receptor protein